MNGAGGRGRKAGEKECDCARCRGVPTANRRWGFDEAEVPKAHCFVCDRPIGKGPYKLDTGLARFGTMLVRHEGC
jgi:hypothetical protein